MKVVPDVQVTRFEQLTPGDLFIYPSDGGSCFALKTDVPPNGTHNRMVILGPDFPYEAEESFILDWQVATVVSFGKNYQIALPNDPANWFLNGNFRQPVCIAVCEREVFVCTNGGPSPQRFSPCFVEFSTGKLVEGRLDGHAAYTRDWELILPNQEILTRTFLKYESRSAYP